jgi:hypothetical protein
VIDLTRPAVSKLLRDKARVSACGRFTTVLGPGADAHHESHIHVDLAERSHGHRLCQWDVREEAPVVAKATPAPQQWPVSTIKPSPAPTNANASATLVSLSSVASEPAPETADVPLPLRRPFELVYAGRKFSHR